MFFPLYPVLLPSYSTSLLLDPVPLLLDPPVLVLSWYLPALPVCSLAPYRFNLDFNILRGTVDDVQGQTLGSLTVLIEAESSVFIEAVNFLRENGVVVEEINDVK